MSFDKIFDLTAGVYFYFHNIASGIIRGGDIFCSSTSTSLYLVYVFLPNLIYVGSRKHQDPLIILGGRSCLLHVCYMFVTCLLHVCYLFVTVHVCYWT